MIREDRLALRCLGIGSLAINLSLLAIFGVRHGNDSVRYLASASDLLAGRPFRGQNGWVYIGYNSLLAVSEAAGGGQLGAIGFQFVAAVCATLALYDLGRQLSGRLAGVLAASFFVIDYDIARWHLYLLTDSLYISLVPIVAWAVHRAAERGAAAYALASALLAITALVRPNGWLLILIAAVYWILRSAFSASVKHAAAAGIVLLCVGAAATLAVVQLGNPPPPRQRLAPPEQASQPLPFAQVMTLRERLDPVQMPLRVLYELIHVQPLFSLRHIVLVLAMLVIVYPLAVSGFARSRGQPLARLMAAIVAGHFVVVAITFNDFDGRYLLYVFPLLVVFAASGAVALGRKNLRRAA
jgi:hypothetical protein